MFILKNALTNIRASKGRNILIGIIVLVIAVSSCIALSVKQAAKKVEQAGLEDLSISATISYDREKLKDNSEDFREKLQKVEEMTLEKMQSYAKASSVKEFCYTMSTAINGNDKLEAVGSDSESDAQSSAHIVNMPGGGNMSGGKMRLAQGDFTLIGYSSYSAMTNFVSGTNKISTGEMFDSSSEKYECIISSQLAAYNKLKVGDTITLLNPNKEDQTFEFRITGIYTYEESENSSSGMRFSTAMDPANQIYTSYNALKSVVSYTEKNAEVSNEITTALMASTNGNYIFASVNDYNKFTKEVTEMGLSDDYKVSSSNLNSYESSLVPIKNTAKFADMLLWIILGVGLVILIVLNIFNIRERKYEVGVLTAIGMKKGKVAMQFVSELLIVTFIAILLGFGIGTFASVPVANSLLESQITAQQEKSDEQSKNFGGMSFAGSVGPSSRPDSKAQNASYISSLNASTDIKVLGELLGIGLLLTLLTSFSAVIFVMRYEPLKILSERT